MKKKELFVPLFLKNGRAVTDMKEGGLLSDGDAAALSQRYGGCGADGILLFDLSEGDEEHDLSIGVIKKIAESSGVPVYGGGNIRRPEDVKKLLYAGCRKIFLNFAKEGNRSMAREVSDRFGKEKILACVTSDGFDMPDEYRECLGGLVWLDADLSVSEGQESAVLERWKESGAEGEVLLCLDAYPENDVVRVLRHPQAGGIASRALMGADDFMERKYALQDSGIAANTYEASLSWDELKTGSDGLLPVVVQDCRTQEVLMVAYMNQEAYETTVRTGRMTYWSRSREELWVKGMTSGHFQYVRELCVDCDNDTLLAKVLQIGAACHTGNKSCFYRSILKKDYAETNPLKVFEDVFSVILDRKEHPKKGSYTNYLFDKGIDKILKKVGEEAAEIVIAAKNPDPEETKYEISDFLYHVMVLMAQKGISWEDITRELARR